MQPNFQDLNDAERQWLTSWIGYARQLVAAYSPADVGQPLNAAILDRTYAAWLASGNANTDQINGVINAIGFAFGQLLIDTVGFKWVVAADQYGTEIALRALPGKGDVLVFPANMVAKRWQTRETGFLVPLFEVVTKQVRDVQANWPGLPPQFK